MIVLSIFITAALIVLGGGSLVSPILIALDLLESSTITYLLVPSAVFYHNEMIIIVHVSIWFGIKRAMIKYDTSAKYQLTREECEDKELQ